jgi:hypothetical protein
MNVAVEEAASLQAVVRCLLRRRRRIYSSSNTNTIDNDSDLTMAQTCGYKLLGNKTEQEDPDRYTRGARCFGADTHIHIHT